MSTVLQVKDLCKTYITNKRQNNVLKNVCFSIEEGEMVAIMGPSGSGKSTLLYSVSGMDKPTAGEVILGDKNIATLSDNELSEVRLKYMGFIFQQMHMLKNLSVIDNILLPAYKLTNDKAKRKEIDEYCNELMRKLDISDIADNDITEVSGGQLQRACICRSMINNPKILFADEPTGALNKSASDDVMKQLTKINEEGTSIIPGWGTKVLHATRCSQKRKRQVFHPRAHSTEREGQGSTLSPAAQDSLFPVGSHC